MTGTVPRGPGTVPAVDTAVTVVAVTALCAAGANWWSRVSVRHVEGRVEGRVDRRVVEAISKPAATIAIGVLAVLVADDAPTAAVVAAVIGFVCCFAGDVALLPAIDRFVVGLASFLAGHLAFVAMFVALGLPHWWFGVVALVALALMAVMLGRPIVAGAARHDRALVRPVQAYLTVISSMAVVGWATGRWPSIVGSAAFVASDSILGWRQFVSERTWMPVAVMVTYHAALVGLALSLA